MHIDTQCQWALAQMAFLPTIKNKMEGEVMFSTSTMCMTYQSKKKISRPGNTGKKQTCRIHTCTSASTPPPPRVNTHMQVESVDKYVTEYRQVHILKVKDLSKQGHGWFSTSNLHQYEFKRFSEKRVRISVPIIDLVKMKTHKHIFSANHCHGRDKNAKKIAIDTTNMSQIYALQQ